MEIYYLRTSTENQDGSHYEIEEKKRKYDMVVFDKGVSGSVPFSQRSGGKKIIDLMNEGKVSKIITQEFSRIGRSISDTLSVFDLFTKNGVCVRIDSHGIESLIGNEINPSWLIVSTTMSLCSELERRLLLERIEEGKRVARSNGVKFGRKHGSNETIMKFMSKPKNQKIKDYLERGYKYEEIIKIVGTSNSTISKVNKHIRTYREYKKKGVSPNQLDLIVESQKPIVEVKPKEKKVLKPQPIIKEIKNMEVYDEEIVFNDEERENIELMKMLNEMKNK
jgi:DNA invertase Pin-like site-specific DNA recombinase